MNGLGSLLKNRLVITIGGGSDEPEEKVAAPKEEAPETAPDGVGNKLAARLREAAKRKLPPSDTEIRGTTRKDNPGGVRG